jgi:large subunit ribosomal protein L16
VLQPKRVKYRKVHRGRMKGVSHRGINIAFGDFALRADETAWITARQIEAARRVLVRYLRQGGGKGAPDHWVSVVKRGRIMFELAGIEEKMAREATHLAGYKLPIATSFTKKEAKSES